jgi:hypothetical protein
VDLEVTQCKATNKYGSMQDSGEHDNAISEKEKKNLGLMKHYLLLFL